MRHSNPFVTGYFVPRLADVVEGGVEAEREFDRATLALDLGGGMQRVEHAGLPISRGRPPSAAGAWWRGS